MKVLLDTNVVLDVLLVREPHFEDAKALFTLVAAESIRGYVTANSILDTYYVACKRVPKIEARAAIRNLMDMFSVISVEERDCERALLIDLSDFEDAVLLCCGKRADIDVIVTRDAELQNAQYGKIQVVAPDALRKMLSHPM